MMARIWLPRAGIVLGLLLILAETISLSGYVGSDFWVFHLAVKRVLADPATLYFDVRGVAGTAETLLGFLYPPPSILMLLPFGAGSAETGFALLSWGALIAAVVSLTLWFRLLSREGVDLPPRTDRIMLVLLALATGPVFTCRGGQVDTLILFIIMAGTTLSWRASARSRALGGAVLAFGTWVKIYPVLILVPLLFDARRRVAAYAGFVAGGILVPLLAAIVFPLSVWITYFTQMLPVMAARTIVNIDNQSIAACIMRLSVPHVQALTTYDAVTVPASVRFGVMALGIGIIAAMQWRVTRTRAPNLIVAGVAMAVISLIAPLGWGHSYAYALPLLVMVAAQAIAQRRWMWLGGIALAWLALLVPAHRQFGFVETTPLLWHMLYSRYAIVTLALIVAAWKLARERRV